MKVESFNYGKAYGQKNDDGYGQDDGYHGEKYGGYVKKSYIPVPYNVNVGSFYLYISLCRKERTVLTFVYVTLHFHYNLPVSSIW